MFRIVISVVLLALIAGCKYAEVHEAPAVDVFTPENQEAM